MTNTLHLGMPFIEGSQAQKHVTHNEALRILDAAIQIGVLDTDRTTPPSTPADGDCHIVASGATGAWAGQAKAVAVREDGAWRFLAPKLGWCAWSDDDGALLVYDGAAWIAAASGGGGSMPDSVDLLGINDTASDPNLLTVRSNAALFNAVDVADGGTGDMRVQISKEDSVSTASVVFSHAFSGRAEFGLVGSDAFKLKVSNDGSTFVEALAFDQTTGNAAFQRGVLLTGVISPSQITSNQNDYAPTGFSAASTLRLSSDASRNVTGLAGGAEGRTIIVHNVGSQSIVFTDQDSASTAANRFLLGASVTLAANASLSLRYDDTTQRWRAISPASSGGGGGGGTAGMTDTERRNALLTLIYQSKSFAECRRLVNLVATGFKGASDALNGINTGASSNYVVTPGTAGATTGCVAPSPASSSAFSRSLSTSNANNNGWGNYTYRIVVKAAALSATGTIGGITFKSGSGGNLDITHATVAIRTGAGADAAATPLPLTFGGASSTTIAAAGGTVTSDPVALTIAGGQDLLIMLHTTSATTIAADATSANTEAYYKSGANDTASLTASGYTNYSGTFQVFHVSGVMIGSGVNNMTLVTAAQTPDSSASNGRVLLEYDDTASATLNTDLTVEVTCNGGTNWTAATLSAVTSYSQGGRKVAETADTACTPGTDFRARIKTLNNKNVPIHGVSVSAH